jgi:hypothetical protein
MNKYNLKTIFWTSTATIILTLTIVSYFTDYTGDSDDSELFVFFVRIMFISFFCFLPAVIIYRLLFGKFCKYDLGDSLLLFWLSTFCFSMYSIDFYLERFLIKGVSIVLAIVLGLIFTIILSKFIFLSKKEEINKLDKNARVKE